MVRNKITCSGCESFELRGVTYGICNNPESKWYGLFLLLEAIPCEFIKRKIHGRKI
jgi:hypothetical protein